MNAELEIPAPSVEAAKSQPTPADIALPGPTPETLRPLTLLQPGRICFGEGVAGSVPAELKGRGLCRPFVVADPAVRRTCAPLLDGWAALGLSCAIYTGIDREPTVAMFETCLREAQGARPDSVIGLGGGSALDVAKLVAALLTGEQSVGEVFGISRLRARRLFLGCLPTTAGTGSEVSPNAILQDENSQLKQGVISPHLVPDASWVDPDLTCTVPTAITASTGLDALTHCIEAFANLHAHPMVDVYALEGIRLITGNLLAAVADGANRPARSRLALGSLYGGLCLGPVNTAAVHALAYPLGSRFHVAHGVSNAVLLPHVLRFNLPAAPERYASIARALGVEVSGSAIAAGEQGILRIEQLIAACPIPRRLSELGIPWTALPGLADAAMTVTRLLKNNPRPLTAPETLEVYHAAW